MTGWSRYDHLAVLAETLPIGIPALALAGAYVLNASIPRGRRLLSLGLVGVLAGSFLVRAPYLIWLSGRR